MEHGLHARELGSPGWNVTRGIRGVPGLSVQNLHHFPSGLTVLAVAFLVEELEVWNHLHIPQATMLAYLEGNLVDMSALPLAGNPMALL